MAWDENSFKAGFTAGRFLWNSHVEYMARNRQPEEIQNGEENEEDDE